MSEVRALGQSAASAYHGSQTIVWRAALLLIVAAVAGCGPARPPTAPQTSAAPDPGPAASGAPAVISTPAAPGESSVVATVDFGTVSVGDVRARLDGVGDDAVLRALGSAVLDELALRELRVIGQGPASGESRSHAVDRLLPQVFGSAGCARVDNAAVRLRFMGELGRFRHPRSWTVWEAFLPCCDDAGCDSAARARCLSETAPAARALVASLQGAMAPLDLAAPVTEGAVWPLATSPAQRDAMPAFEGTLAAAPMASGRAWQLRRYTFFGRGDERFPESSFRRVDPALEAAVANLGALGAVAGPVELERGWSVAMLAAHEPTRWANVTDADVATALRAEACAVLVQQERDAWLERLGNAATVRWHPEVVRAVWGAGVAARLPVWSRTERLRAAAPTLP